MKRPLARLIAILVLTVGTAVGFSAWAEGLSSEFRDLDSVDAAHRPTAFDKVRNATFQINESCTATFVSNEGHVLTAMHCLKARMVMPSERFNDMKFTLYKLEKEMIGMKVNLSMSFDRKKETDVTATIFGGGKGFVTGIEPIKAFKANPNKYLDLMEEKYGAAEDYVILKLDLENTPCLPVATEPVAVGDPVWSINFPWRDAGVQGRPSWTGTGAAFSSGQITNSLLDNTSLAELLEGASAEYQQAFVNVEGAMNNADTLTASVDTLTGASGGALLNEQGEIVGIFSLAQAFVGTVNDRYIYGSALLGNAQAAVQKLKANLGEDQANKIFSCH